LIKGANVEKYVVDADTEIIGKEAFRNCNSLDTIVLNNVIEIKEHAFLNCSSLQSLVVPDSVTNIEYGAFYGCESLTDITIPDSVTYIGYEAFDKCKNLTIACNKGSYAQRFASREGIPVKYIKDKTKTIERD
jgi:hypothetical protein